MPTNMAAANTRSTKFNSETAPPLKFAFGIALNTSTKITIAIIPMTAPIPASIIVVI